MIVFDPRLEIARGNLPGQSIVRKPGRNPSIDSGDPRTEVWGGGAPYVFPSNSGVAMTVSSSSTDDDVGGSGATSVTVTGLTPQFYSKTVTVDLDGRNAVSIGTFSRINDVQISTGTLNVGDVYVGSGTVTLGVPANNYAVIKAGYGRLMQAIYTVPRARTGYLTGISCGILEGSSGILEGSTGKTADLGLCIHNSDGPAIVQDCFGLSSASTGYIHKVYSIPIPIEEKHTVVMAIDDVSANGTAIVASFSIVLVVK